MGDQQHGNQVMTRLSESQREMVRALFPGDTDHWVSRIEAGALTTEEIEWACDVLNDEFHMNGIDQNFEATEHGKNVEALLDLVNRPRLHPAFNGEVQA